MAQDRAPERPTLKRVLDWLFRRNSNRMSRKVDEVSKRADVVVAKAERTITEVDARRKLIETELREMRGR